MNTPMPKNIFLLIPSYLLLILFSYLALLIYGPSNDFILWKAAIAAKEYGHWFALLAFVMVGVWAKKNHSQRKFLLPSFLILGLSFLYPLTAALYLEDSYATSLHNIARDKNSEKVDLIDFKGLITGFSFEETIPQKLEFARYEKTILSLDFYPAKSLRPAPWVLIVHAGGWDSGSSDQLTFVNSLLADRGYGVVAINYRLAPQYTWPAQNEDVKAAVAFIRENAVKLNLDPARWVIMGRSAGGQIAGVTAYTHGDLPPKGLISLYAPTDLVYSWNHSRRGDILEPLDLLKNFIGGTLVEKREGFESASPLRLAGKDSPPTLILHGQMDTLVYPQHSKRLNHKLKELGVPVAYMNFPWATHGFDFALRGPGGMIATRSILYFLSQVL